MKLIGMLDSPYVRRVAISFQLLGLTFEHQPLSVFRTFDEFREINPVVKAPTLVCADGTVLMDSTLILEYAEAVAHPRSLMPSDLNELKHDLALIGLALAATEKSVQLVYEGMLRPPEKRHEPWVRRITGQLLDAYRELESRLPVNSLGETSESLRQAGVTIGVAWQFSRQMIPDVVRADSFPAIAAYSAILEALPEFSDAPHGEGVYQQ